VSKVIAYTVFRTRWGYFGLVGTEDALLRTVLPMRDRQSAESQLLKFVGVGYRAGEARCDKMLFNSLQEQISDYFEGSYVAFHKDIPLLLEGVSPFGRSVLAACRGVRYGRTISYGRLAAKAGFPKAARAIGGVMARNPVPLIIPCHRVIRSDGKIGGFSAAGSVSLKKRLLKMERQHGGNDLRMIDE